MATSKQRPDITLSILEKVCSSLALLEEPLERAAYSPASVRLAYFFLANADFASDVLTNMTHEEIGNSIGSVRQAITVNLMPAELLRLGTRTVTILDRQGLEEIANGPPGRNGVH